MKSLNLLFVAAIALIPPQAHAFLNQFEVGTGNIHNTLNAANNSYDQFSFGSSFANPPAVFTLPRTNGGHSCIIRMQNIDQDGFEALCAEDSSYDGEHTNVPFQYIAVREGVQTIPSNAGALADVTFEVGCVDTTAVQHNCTSGCPTESSVPITFSNTLTNPVVLTSIQTSNNQTLGAPPTNPIEPMLSPVVDNLNGTGFDLALDFNKEDNIASINPERVCWLAVEQVSRCDIAGVDQTLDFSAIGGPQSVAFESIVTPNTVDGWDQGCNAGEGATFTPTCFANTPVAVASLRSRNAAEGEDEGWLRYCQLDSGQLRVTIDEQTSTRDHVNEQASVLAFGSSFSTPVTLASFTSRQDSKRKLSFTWATESESFNVGFNLWAQVGGEWQQINQHLIASDALGLRSGESYSEQLKLSEELLDNITAVGISSLDNSGYEEFFGPFEIGESYGEDARLTPIDWTHVRAEYENTMRAAGFVKIGQQWHRPSDRNIKRAERKQLQLNREIVQMQVERSGIVKVTFDQLALASTKFADIALNRVALTHNGVAVPRIIESSDKRFNAGDSVLFYAPDLSPELALYDKHLTYRLEVNAAKAISSRALAGLDLAAADSFAQQHLESHQQTAQTVYSPTSTSGDPWFMHSIRSIGAPAERDYQFTIPSLPQSVPQPSLLVTLSGGLDFPGVASQAPDHHVQVLVNGTTVLSQRFDGFSSERLEVSFDDGLLTEGVNDISLRLPGDTGQFADLVMIDSVELRVPQRNVLSDGGLIIDAQAAAEYYSVFDSPSQSELTVFATQANGNFAMLNEWRVVDGVLQFAALLDQNQLEDLSYRVLTEADYVQVTNSRVIQPRDLVKAIERAQPDYLVVAHPNFINQDLQKFIDVKQALGHEPMVVSWLDVVETYGFGINSPFALQSMLARLTSDVKLQNLLLVGGHSYDYNDYLANGNVTFIPAFYQKVSKYFNYAPSDNGFADVDADGLPDLAIGRWPVRSQQDLQRIVAKTITWHDNADSYRHRSLLVSDLSDANRGQNFRQQLEELAPQLSDDLDGLDITRIHLDDYSAQNIESPIEQAKVDFLQEFAGDAAGVGLTMFNGHASASRWTFRNLFNASDAASMANVNAPSVVMPLACYTTYYEEPSDNSLAHQLLFASEGGAVAISGAAYLGDYRENALFASKILNLKNKHDLSWGEAILRAKQSMLEWNDVVTNWTYLGDPSIK